MRNNNDLFAWAARSVGACTFVAALIMGPAVASARDDINSYSIEKAISTWGARAGLPPMPMYFGDTAGPTGAVDLGELRTSNKTSAIGKSDEEACQWVFLTSLKSLQNAARKRGATALVNIRSNYKNNEFKSATEFQCGAGNIIAGVALKAQAVRVDAAGAALAATPAAAPVPAPAPAVAPAPVAATAPTPPPPAGTEKPDGIGTLASPAAGSETDDLAKARRRFEKGQRLYDLRRYMESIPEFEAAYELSGDPVLLYNLAQSYRMAEKYPDALHYYRAYLKKVPKSPRTDVVKRRIAELEATREPPNNVDDPHPRK
ncbi:MAG: tetratricopeptide repeat protein [Deltaproteobacteria bacterium]|nr:tetratricopeptide repeat protein [Deltaproteobacteria bacterium]